MEAFKNWLEHKAIGSNTLNCVIQHIKYLSKHCLQSSPSNQWCHSFALQTNSNLHYDTRKETKDSVSKIFGNQLKKQTHYINTHVISRNRPNIQKWDISVSVFCSSSLLQPKKCQLSRETIWYLWSILQSIGTGTGANSATSWMGCVWISWKARRWMGWRL